MSEPIKGFASGPDYDIACAMCRIFAADHGWSRSEKKPTKGIHFDYEFTMSKRGKKDSNNPALSITLTWTGNGKTVEIKRYGKWSACFGLREDGTPGGGQYRKEQGLADLNELMALYHRAKMEVEA